MHKLLEEVPFMKPSFIYTSLISLILLTACSFIANADENSIKSEADRHSVYNVKMQSEIIEFEEYHITIHYPETPNDKINQMISDYVNQKIALFKQASYKAVKLNNKGHAQSHELHVDFEVVYQDQQFFVVRFLETVDIGLSEIAKRQTVMNFYKKNGNRLDVDDLFKDSTNLLKEIQDLTEMELQKQGYDAYQYSGPMPRNFSQVAIHGDGLAIYLEPGFEVDYVILNRESLEGLVKAEVNKSRSPEKMSEVKKFTKVHPVNSFIVDPSSVFSGSEKKVALTFDDGPHPERTPAILDVLEKYNANGTFYMLGKRVSYFPDIAKEVAARGHEVGNHTWDHPRLTRLSQEEVSQQMVATKQIIKHVTGQNTNQIRLPFGENPSTPYPGQMEIVPWDLSVESWRKDSPEKIAETFINEIENGDIVLLHDLEPSTVEVLDIMLAELSRQGYQFVTVSELD